MEYQINNCLEYNNNARKVAPYKNVKFILDEIENDSNYFHNVTKIGKLLGFNNREMISVACKYSKCLIWDELLQFAEKNEIDSSIAQKIKKINSINSKVKGNLNLKMINEWDGQLTSLEIDQHIDSKVFTGHAAQQKDFSLAFYTYNEEFIRIKPDGNLFYSSVEGL